MIKIRVLLRSFLYILDERDEFITAQCNRLGEGIGKIDEAAEQIDQLSIMVEEQRKNVVSSAEDCETMLVGIQECKYL